MDPTDTYLIDKCKIFREGLKKLLPEPEFRVRGEANAIDELGGITPTNRPGMVLAEFPEGDPAGMARLEALGREPGSPRFVVFASKMNFDWVCKSLVAGAAGFLLKEMSSDALLLSLRLVMAGEIVLPTDLARFLVDGRMVGGREMADMPDLKCLSDRERHVLQSLVLGHSNKVIARDLKIAEGTVKVHLKGVLKKLNLRNRTQAAVWALNSGLTASNRATIQ